MKRTISALLSAVMLGTILSGCGGAASSGSAAATTPEASGKARTVKVASCMAATHPMNIALREVFKKEVEEKTGGAFKIEVYDGGMLGGEKEIYDSVRNGNIDISVPGTTMWNEVEKMSIPDWPFLFRDVKHARKVLCGEVGEEIAASMEEKAGVHFLAWGPNGARVFSSNRPVTKIEDFKGLRIRMPNNPIHIKLGELLGANVTPMPMGEVFTALEQKVVDGQDNPLSTFRNEGWYEVQSDVFISNHMISSLEILASDKFWTSITEEQAKIVKDAAIATQEKAWDLYEQSIEDDIVFFKDAGLNVVIPDEATKAQLVELVDPIYEDLYKQYDWAKDMVEKVRAVQ